MDSNEKVITNFETRVRQLILRFQDLKKENEELYTMVEKAEQEVDNLDDAISTLDDITGYLEDAMSSLDEASD